MHYEKWDRNEVILEEYLLKRNTKTKLFKGQRRHIEVEKKTLVWVRIGKPISGKRPKC